MKTINKKASILILCALLAVSLVICFAAMAPHVSAAAMREAYDISDEQWDAQSAGDKISIEGGLITAAAGSSTSNVLTYRNKVNTDRLTLTFGSLDGLTAEDAIILSFEDVLKIRIGGDGSVEAFDGDELLGSIAGENGKENVLNLNASDGTMDWNGSELTAAEGKSLTDAYFDTEAEMKIAVESEAGAAFSLNGMQGPIKRLNYAGEQYLAPSEGAYSVTPYPYGLRVEALKTVAWGDASLSGGGLGFWSGSSFGWSVEFQLYGPHTGEFDLILNGGGQIDDVFVRINKDGSAGIFEGLTQVAELEGGKTVPGAGTSNAPYKVEFDWNTQCFRLNGIEFTAVAGQQYPCTTVNPEDWLAGSYRYLGVRMNAEEGAGIKLLSYCGADLIGATDDANKPTEITWKAWDGAQEPNYKADWANNGAVPYNVNGGIAVKSAHKGWQSYITSNGGKGSLKGLMDVSNFSIDLVACTLDKIGGVDVLLRGQDGKNVCIRVLDLGEEQFKVNVFDYNTFALIGDGTFAHSGATYGETGFKLYSISWNTAGNGDITVDGQLVPAGGGGDYHSFKDFPSYNATLSLGVEEDDGADDQEMFVVTSINGKAMKDFGFNPNVNYTASWAADAGIALSNDPAGLKAVANTAAEGAKVAFAGNAKHNVKTADFLATASGDYTLEFILTGKSPSEDATKTLRIAFVHAGTAAVSVSVYEGETLLGSADSVASEGGTIQTAIDALAGTLTVNGTDIDIGDANLLFQYNNAEISFAVTGGTGSSFVLEDFMGDELKYYVAAPNAEVDTSADPAEFWEVDPWNDVLATMKLSKTDTSLDFTVSGTRTGMWSNLPLSYTTSMLNNDNRASYLSVYVSVADENQASRGFSVNFCTKTGDGFSSLTSALIIEISNDGKSVLCYNASWGALTSGAVKIGGDFSSDGNNGFLVEYDCEANLLYVNGVQIAGNFGAFNFPNNNVYLGIFGSSQTGTESTVQLKYMNGENVITREALTAEDMVEFEDPDVARVEEQLDMEEIPSGSQINMNVGMDSETGKVTIWETEKYIEKVPTTVTETYTEEVIVGYRLTGGGIAGIAVGGAAAIAAAVILIVVLRKRSKTK